MDRKAGLGNIQPKDLHIIPFQFSLLPCNSLLPSLCFPPGSLDSPPSQFSGFLHFPFDSNAFT